MLAIVKLPLYWPIALPPESTTLARVTVLPTVKLWAVVVVTVTGAVPTEVSAPSTTPPGFTMLTVTRLEVVTPLTLVVTLLAAVAVAPPAGDTGCTITG